MLLNKLIHGDCLEVMPQLEAGSIQTCVTSPPYYGLRDYGVTGQIGLEETPEVYIAQLVAVFREVRRVLKDDGTLWLNLGDSYASNTKGSGGHDPDKRTLTGSKKYVDDAQHFEPRKIKHGLKEKDLLMIPARVAIALQADGWYLRSEIVWAKPNPMPESVKDRPTKSHEMIYLLSKSPRYYYDADAIKEPSADFEGSKKRYKSEFFVGDKHESGGYSANGAKHTGGMKIFDGKRNARDVWTVAAKPYKGAHFATFPPALIEPCILAGSAIGDYVLDPFSGSGTTGMVALKHGRNYIGIDLNAEYIKMAEARIAQ